MKEHFFPIDVVRKIPSEALSAAEKLTLILLLDYLNCKEIYVSAARIAEGASLSVPTVERAFRKFKRMKIMSTRKVRRGGSYLHVKTFNLGALRALSRPLSDENRIYAETAPDFEIDLSSL